MAAPGLPPPVLPKDLNAVDEKKTGKHSSVLIYPARGNSSSGVTAILQPGKDNGCLFHDQTILYGFYPFDAPYDFQCFIDGLLRINEAAQLNGALVRFDTDLK
jgi:hypothetical protein